MDEVRRFERMKKCPFCAEDILVAAIKCKHCGSNLGVPDTPVIPPRRSIWTRDVRDINTNKLWAFLVVVGVCFWLFRVFDSPKRPDSATTSAVAHAPIPEASPPRPNVPAPSIPLIESHLIEIIAGSQRESRDAANDMQKGGADATKTFAR
jgi:hypothetical protein